MNKIHIFSAVSKIGTTKFYWISKKSAKSQKILFHKESRLNRGRRMSITPESFDVEEQETSSENLDTELTDFFKDLGISLSPKSIKKLELAKWKHEFANNLLKSLSEEDNNKKNNKSAFKPN